MSAKDDFERMLVFATSYRRTANFLQRLVGAYFKDVDGESRDESEETQRAEIGSHIISVTVLRALAAEIMLKALIDRKTGNFKGTHNLLQLFQDLDKTLDPSTKKRIGELETQRKINLEQTFKQHKDDFVEWRYGYEKPSVHAELQDLEKALGILDTLI